MPECRGADDGTYEDAFREAFTAAVTARLPARDAGVYLSGGLDPSSVTCVAHGVFLGGPLAAFSAVFDDEPRSDERRYAAAAASHVVAESVLCHTERTSPLADWSGAPWTWPRPQLRPASGGVPGGHRGGGGLGRVGAPQRVRGRGRR